MTDTNTDAEGPLDSELENNTDDTTNNDETSEPSVDSDNTHGPTDQRPAELDSTGQDNQDNNPSADPTRWFDETDGSDTTNELLDDTEGWFNGAGESFDETTALLEDSGTEDTDEDELQNENEGAGEDGAKPGLFDDLLSGEPIFETKEVLRPSYTPQRLPHREDQINNMATILVSALRGETPSNILIYGKTGTGKTASAKFVSEELESTSEKYEMPCNVQYINCEVTDTQYRVLAQLANTFIQDNKRRVEERLDTLYDLRERARNQETQSDNNGQLVNHDQADDSADHDQVQHPPADDGVDTNLETERDLDDPPHSDQSIQDSQNPQGSTSSHEDPGVDTPAAGDPEVASESGVLAGTEFETVEELSDRIEELEDDREELEPVPMTGWPTDRVYTTFFDAIDYHERVVVIMLDEIDKLVEKSGDDTLYNLSRMNSDLDNSRVSIIGISNDLKFTDFLDPRVKSSLGEEEIVFPPYDATQLKDILQHRAEVAFKPNALSDDVIPLCAAFAAQEHGDARRALDLLRTAGELAERNRTNFVEETHVRSAQEKIELDRVVEVVRTLPTQSKLVLYAIILLEHQDVDNINTGEVFNIYKRLCSEIDMDVLTQRRVTDLISELDMLGIVNAVVVSKGRYGRTKEMSLSVPLEETKTVLLSDSRLADVEEAQPLVQARFDN